MLHLPRKHCINAMFLYVFLQRMHKALTDCQLDNDCRLHLQKIQIIIEEHFINERFDDEDIIKINKIIYEFEMFIFKKPLPM